jgi:adenylate cyclase class 2
MANEVEIKFRVDDLQALQQALPKAGFRLKTSRTHEMNTLYDVAGQKLRRRGELLRLRKYGSNWVLTHKAKGKIGRHKTRAEIETRVDDGEQMHEILTALGFTPTFRYEKFRAEWADQQGHVVVDETPIGNFGEIEGPPRWIDQTAKALGVGRDQYVTSAYTELFFDWKRSSRSSAREMTFKAVGKKPGK